MNLNRFLKLLLMLGLIIPQALSAPLIPPDHGERLVRGLEIFQKDIRALLLEHCVKCHGGEKTKGGFDLTTREGLLKGGDGGAAVELYDAKVSKLYHLITHTEEPAMPAKGKKLSSQAIAQVTAWINNGAPYDKPLIEKKTTTKKDRSTITDTDRQWWSFKPLHPSVPPPTKALRGRGTPIDRFIVAQLEKKNLSLNPVADRRTLIRRASFDLRGLPPTPHEVNAFLSDTNADAWSTVVTQFLGSPNYGERWARHWLDVARFAESSGFEHDYDRPNAYHFRDFVIKALNSDMPFDQFVQWQLAGDEFAPENPLALMATGFLGAGVFPTQITANEVERVRYDAMDDMLATTGTAMLGLTVGCARCHDHKFDPIPASDYYRMLSTFTTTVRSDIELDLRPDAFATAKVAFERERAALEKPLRAYEESELPAKFDLWLKSGAPLPMRPVWEFLDMKQVLSKAGTTFKKLEDESFLAEGTNGDSDVYTFKGTTRTSGLRALRLEALTHTNMVKNGPGRADNGNIGLSRVRVFTSPLAGGKTNEIKLTKARATFEQNTTTLSINGVLDENPKTGWAIDPKFGTNHTAIFEFDEPIQFEGEHQISVQLEFNLNTRHNIGRPRLAVTTSKAASFEGDLLPHTIANLITKLHSSKKALLGSEEKALLQNWWKYTEPHWKALHDKIEVYSKNAPRPELTKVLVCAEGFPPLRMHTQGADFFPETYFLNRGSTEAKKGVATAGFLQVLLKDSNEEKRWSFQPPVGAKYSGRRRALAQWMSDSDHGAGHLMARVIVNRLWQHHFGQGLVTTPNDFGVQGVKPTHPELLDWLASELIRGGWRLKPLHQLMMTSEVYQQSTRLTPARLKADPMNSMLSRRTPQRLEAESIRDSLLFVSGVMDTNMFGPGTLDESSRRRSIYFTVKRSSLVPAMQSFDAPEPLVSQGTRPTTTVAPQALLLMNSDQVRSWAHAFTQRIAPTHTATLSENVAAAYNLALNRLPAKQELKNSLLFIESQRARYSAEQQTNTLGMAFTDFAQIVLSLNEFIYVD